MRLLRLFGARVILVSLVLFLPCPIALADEIWTGIEDTQWNNDNNWDSLTPIRNEAAIFNSTFTNQPNLTSDSNVGAIWFTDGIGQNVAITGDAGPVLTFSDVTINGIPDYGILVDNTNTFSLTIAVAIKIGNAQMWANESGNLLSVAGPVDLNNRTLTVNGSGDTLISGVINDNGSLVKSGTGTVTLSAINTFNESVTIDGGTLAAASASGNSLGSVSSITVNSGGTFFLGAS